MHNIQLHGRADIRRILLVKWSALGDVIISTAILEDLRQAFPNATIDLNILPPWDRLFRQDTRVNNLLVIDLRGQDKGWKGVWRWLKNVRRNKYDLVIDLQSNDRSRFLISALRILSPVRPILMGNRRSFPYHLSPPWKSKPIEVAALDQFRQTLAAGGIQTSTPRPVLQIPQENLERAAQMLKQHGLSPQGFAALIPGCQAAGHLKRWGTENYVALARKLHEATLEKIVLVGGKDEIKDCAEIEAACGDWVVNLCGKTEIFDLVPIFEQAKVIIGNDTGPTHLASCTERPIVVICGPTDPRRVKPAGDNVRAIQADLPCINCYQKECDHHSCMKAITPEMVFEMVKPELENNRGESRDL
ncbi:glycosyltransferase family 9 protein [Geoalkalibacter halelectricus]|uniref:Glycosyltransferase family 9 protein n=1 Tax=Geoalkalibacter halelectricus TaxID=2847045 RepID=A0ABY5ZLN4_9BACT|nr:glycosyltransferase family 9 protein [Geoalkalibacter halelectricus]MDO3379584.1 glycosyltransferase family 9 protein [Geoalkalibacter halelectricus]UWZ78171.1 glycosyltransferase family 9 protein [Geoalkalibacter halelectricus]